MPWLIQNMNDVHTGDLIIAFIYFKALKLRKQFKSIEFVFIAIHRNNELLFVKGPVMPFQTLRARNVEFSLGSLSFFLVESFKRVNIS